MQNKKNIQYVEAIKLAAGGVQYKNLSVKKTMVDAVDQLNSYYKNTTEKNYLEVATLFIQAYLEMGFPYQEGAIVFEQTLSELGTNKEIQYPSKFFAEKQIKLNRTQVRNMIKRWPASPHQSMKINEVVDDIIEKVKKRTIGIFYYKCAVTKDMYELVINENEMFFHDLKRGIFFTFLI